MELVVGAVLVILVAAGLVVWSRRHGNPGERGHDPYGNRNLAANGGVPNTTPGGDSTGGGAGG